MINEVKKSSETVEEKQESDISGNFFLNFKIGLLVDSETGKASEEDVEKVTDYIVSSLELLADQGIRITLDHQCSFETAPVRIPIVKNKI